MKSRLPSGTAWLDSVNSLYQKLGKNREKAKKFQVISQSLPEAVGLGGKDGIIVLLSSSNWRKGSIRSSFAGNRSETFAIHFSINALTTGSFTFPKDAGLIPFKEKIKNS